MLRLSQRGWNNVIIFAMLFMILLFNSTNNLLLDNAENSAEQRVLPENAPVMVLNYGQHKLERIGRGWRINPSLELGEAELAAIVEHWQLASGTKIPALELSKPYVVVVWLAGHEQGQVFKLLPQGDDLLLWSEQGSYILPDTPLSHLIPEELF